MNKSTGIAVLGLLTVLGAVSSVQAMRETRRVELCVEEANHNCKNNGCGSVCGHPERSTIKGSVDLSRKDSCFCLSE